MEETSNFSLGRNHSLWEEVLYLESNYSSFCYMVHAFQLQLGHTCLRLSFVTSDSNRLPRGNPARRWSCANKNTLLGCLPAFSRQPYDTELIGSCIYYPFSNNVVLEELFFKRGFQTSPSSI